MMVSKRALACLVALNVAMFAGPVRAESIRIVALGDSNTAGLRVAAQEAFPAQLEAMLRMRGYDVLVANAGISGDTTQGMLGRIEGSVPPGTRIVIVQGGYNDQRRGGSPAARLANVDAILSRLRARGITAVLCGYYQEPWAPVARRNGAVFVPNTACYDGGYLSFDGLHMNAAGHQVVASRLRPVVQRLLMVPRRGGR